MELVGEAKTQLVSFITAMIAALRVIKTQIELYANIDNLVDEAKKIGLQAWLEVVEASVAPIEAPFNMVLNYTKALADCDPVNTLANIIKQAKDKTLKPVEDMRYDIEQLIAAIEDQKREIETIERWIDALEKLRDVLEECGSE